MILRLDARRIETLVRDALADATSAGSIRPALLAFAEGRGIPV
jgi:hypothetical protein